MKTVKNIIFVLPILLLLQGTKVNAEDSAWKKRAKQILFPAGFLCSGLLIGYFWRRSGEKKRIEKTVNNPENQKEVNELKEMMAPLFTTNSRIKMKEVDKIAKKVCKLDSKSVIKISTLELSEILYRIQIGKTTEKSARNNVLTISKVAEVWEKGYKDLEQELAELKHLKNTRLMEN